LEGLTALFATDAAAKAIKAFWHERRPNGEDSDSFPSEHAGDCFAAAIILARESPETIGPASIGLATAVAMARVFSGKHHVADVIAGGSLGVLAGELSSASARPRWGRTR
jgi:membrane-associated phospholipid phosphatase